MSRSTHSQLADIFRSLLREIREEYSLTQAELAKRLALPQSYVSKFETGERRLDFVETAELCAVLGIKLSELAKRYESRATSLVPVAAKQSKRAKR